MATLINAIGGGNDGGLPAEVDEGPGDGLRNLGHGRSFLVMDRLVGR